MRTKIVHGRVVTCTGQVLEDGEILFDTERILRVGRNTGEADRVIDAAGRTVLPGFIDCHIHPGELSEQDPVAKALTVEHNCMELLKSGITTARAVGTKYCADVTLRNMIDRGEISGPRLKAAGEVICITCGHGVEIGVECDTVGETLKAARSLCKQKVDWLKFMPTAGVIGVGPPTEVQLSREQIEAIISVGRAFNTPTCAHLMNREAMEICIEAGLTCVEHGYAMDEAIARRMVELGTWYVPTVVVTFMESTRIQPKNQTDREVVEKAAAMQVRARQALATAIRCGVKMAVGTDTGCPYTNPSTAAYAAELGFYSQFGMANEEILRCATIRGAELLGIDGVTGTLEEGKRADVIVMDGNPLEDIRCAKDIDYTFCEGRLLYRGDRDLIQ